MVMDIKAQSQCQRPAKPFKICQNHGEKVRYSVRSTLPLMISRRHFIQNSLAATAALALPSTALAEFFEYPAFDLHCHPGLFVAKGDPRYLGDAKAVKTVTEMNEGKVMGAFVGLVADAPIIEATPTGIKTKRPYEASEPWKEYQRQMAILRELLKTFPATLSTETDALDAAL